MPTTFACASPFLYAVALLHDKASPGLLCPRGSLNGWVLVAGQPSSPPPWPR